MRVCGSYASTVAQGYRVLYFPARRIEWVLLLGGGSKRSQAADIQSGKEVRSSTQGDTEADEASQANRAATSYDQWARGRLAAAPELSTGISGRFWSNPRRPKSCSWDCGAWPRPTACARVAAAAGLSRESLYRSLSAAGNPRLSTLVAVLRVAGLRLFRPGPRRSCGRRQSDAEPELRPAYRRSARHPVSRAETRRTCGTWPATSAAAQRPLPTARMASVASARGTRRTSRRRCRAATARR